MNNKVAIRRLPTGVPGLDAVLGGGVSEFSFNILAGAPGAGKTTLAQQMMFSLASPDRKAIFFTVLGEPPLKMLRYQQQYSFFDSAKLDECIRFVNLGDEVLAGDFDRVLARIVREVEEFEPGLVFVDSFRSVAKAAEGTGKASTLQNFVQQLGMHLTNWQATTFLIGEYMTVDSEANPVFTIADGILLLMQSLNRDSVVRKIQVAKSRGQAPIGGLHTFKMSVDGIRVYPRTLSAGVQQPGVARGVAGPKRGRLSMGTPILDDMMGGGLPAGYSLLVAGPSGSGKSILATAFLEEGARLGEKGVVAAFEIGPGESRNPRLELLVAEGKIAVVDTRALDLSIDETLYALTELIQRTDAKRLVIDSLSGFELALAPAYREDFRESLHRMVAVLTSMGATVLMISELEDRYDDLRFSPYGAAFLTDAIIVQRYVELEGDLKRVMAVVKVRNTSHSHALRLYEITEAGIVIGEHRPDMNALLTGHPRRSASLAN
jgi:circadian clock protein KaiC